MAQAARLVGRRDRERVMERKELIERLTDLRASGECATLTTRESEALTAAIEALAAPGAQVGDRLHSLSGEIEHFASVADDDNLTVVNAPAAMRAWAARIRKCAAAGGVGCPHASRCDCIGACKHGFAGNGASPAPPAQVGEMTSTVYMICTAYESGIGHGLQQDRVSNPYAPRSNESEAWQIGYDEGVDRARLCTCPSAADTIEALQRRVAELEAELLWIERQGDEFSHCVLQDQPGDGDHYVTGLNCKGQGATFRAAIDAARGERDPPAAKEER